VPAPVGGRAPAVRGAPGRAGWLTMPAIWGTSETPAGVGANGAPAIAAAIAVVALAGAPAGAPPPVVDSRAVPRCLPRNAPVATFARRVVVDRDRREVDGFSFACALAPALVRVEPSPAADAPCRVPARTLGDAPLEERSEPRPWSAGAPVAPPLAAC